MSQTFTAATCCQRAHRHIAAARTRRDSAACTGFVAIFAHALIHCSADRLLIPVHD